MILLIDNYGNFSYSLYQLAGRVNSDIRMIKNDELTLDEIRKLSPQLIILSPGPGRPEEAGVCLSVVKELGQEIPIFGVGLGYLVICRAFGGTVMETENAMCGSAVTIRINNQSKLFGGMRETMQAGCYHAQAVSPESIPQCLQVIAATEKREVMGVEHREYPVYGVLFHPESILTPQGYRLMENLLVKEVYSRSTSGRILLRVREMRRESMKNEEEEG